jgi:hypothetical protein
VRAAPRFAAALASWAVPALALACGAFFADGVTVDPSQKIVVVHRDGVETYLFRPHFCGTTRDFAVVLPVPDRLLSAPFEDQTARDVELYAALDAVSAPRVTGACAHGIVTACGPGSAGAPGSGGATPPPVNVVDAGRVGAFDYSLLQATSAAALTDWLDQNGFPHDPAATAAYEGYVARGWYFVTFRFTASAADPPAGKRVCGDFGPIRLSFPAAAPVIPARIAAVNAASGSYPIWRVFVLAVEQQQLDPTSIGFSSTPYFAKTLQAGDLAQHPGLDRAAVAGDRLTVLDVTFWTVAPQTDIVLRVDPSPSDQQTTTCDDTATDSGGCGQGAAGGDGFLELFAYLALLAAWRGRPGRSRRGLNAS